VSFADLEGGSGPPDVLISGRASGDVAVLHNDGTGHFALRGASLFRAGLGPGDTGLTGNESLAQTVSVGATPFTTGGRPGVVAVDRGTHQLVALTGTPGGGLTDPTAALSFLTDQGQAIGTTPGQIVAADFNHDGKTDLAVLLQDLGQVWVYLGNGEGNAD